MITTTLGVREYDGTVYYLHSGMPIFSHESADLTKFRYITPNLILQGLCNNQDIADTFHVSTDSVRRWKKKLSEEGDVAFFKEESRHGRSHELLPQVLDRIQLKLTWIGSNRQTRLCPQFIRTSGKRAQCRGIVCLAGINITRVRAVLQSL